MRAWLPLLILALCACAQASRPDAATTLRALLPKVELSTLDGQLTEVQNLTSGKVALLALWAPWCEACAAELSALERLHDSAGPRGAVVIAIAVGEPRSKIAEFVATRALRFPQLVDEQFHLADALGQRRVPATLILDRSGRVTYAGGALDGAALSALRAALEPRALAQN